MRPVNDYLDEYALSHQNKINKMVHYICVPLITWSTLGLLWSINPIAYFALVVLAMTYYFMMSPKLAWGMLLFISPSLLIVTHPKVLMISVAVFLLSWVVQIWGHKVEGKKPSFLKDLQFLLIGPLWILNKIYTELGLFELSNQKQ